MKSIGERWAYIKGFVAYAVAIFTQTAGRNLHWVRGTTVMRCAVMTHGYCQVRINQRSIRTERVESGLSGVCKSGFLIFF